jgi:hypothetical protein
VGVGAHDYDAAGKPACAWDDPAARDVLVTALVTDALAVLAAVAGQPLDQTQADAVGLLALVAAKTSNPATPTAPGDRGGHRQGPGDLHGRS